ncbi:MULTISPECIES: LuxR C-terminal-related transcriptional regulator [unclassified Streptomyces]|uniref:helix-turn-helix transcriptional regulator n=1 Tax=unclassified Streptomyces TaxID=2593676 RepID=UPI00344FEF21
MKSLARTDDLAQFKSATMVFLGSLVPISGSVFYSVASDLTPVDHVFHRIDASHNVHYDALFHRLDPFHPRRFHASGRPVVTVRDLPGRYHGSEYHHRFMSPLGLDFEAELYLWQDGLMVGGISLHRSSALSDFTAAELAQLNSALPFIEHSFVTQRAFETARQVEEWGLTKREREVLRLVRDGASNAEIGRRLQISVPTVKSHLQHVYDKSAIRSRLQLVARLGGTG